MRPEQFIVPTTTQTTIGLTFVSGLVATAALLLSPVLAAVICTGAAAGYLALAVFAIDSPQFHTIFDLPFPLLNLSFCFLAMLMYRVIFEQAQQRALKGAMSQYLSPDVMEEVVRDPSRIKLGGEKREMTVMFSDIRGFTSLAETLDPAQLVRILNI